MDDDGATSNGVELTTANNGGDDNYRAVDSGDDHDEVREGCNTRFKLHPMEWELTWGKWTVLRFNPIVMGISFIIIWAFVIWATTDSKQANIDISAAQVWIISTFTWLYQGSLAAFMVLSLYLAFSEYGDIKLGDTPQYSFGTWFAMLFSAGIGIGLFFFGVAEPITHFKDAVNGNSRFGSLPLNYQALAALNLTWFHWGFAASSVYGIVGLPIAYYAHNKGMPMTIRTCFYSLWGDGIYGPMGDVVDILAVVGTMFGVGTSLGLGVMQINTGLNRLDSNIMIGTDQQVFIIIVVTIVATISVVTGLDVGIRRISEFNFLLGLFLLFFFFFVGDTVYILNLFVETVGYHLQHILELTFFTDTYSQSHFTKAVYSEYNTMSNSTDPQKWMGWWSVFYWAWWIAWSPFVGVFIASISKGRTVREFIMGNIIVPTILTSVWFTVFGGLGIQQEMTAMLSGIQCCSKASPCITNCCCSALTPFQQCNADGTTTIAKNMIRLSCRSSTHQLFDLIDAFPIPGFIGVVTMISMITYFVTSSDSASLVIDSITSNGKGHPPVLQRVFWAVMEGAVAIALLVAGGADALTTLQTASIASGLPLTFVLIGLAIATKRAFDTELGYYNPEEGNDWNNTLMNRLFRFPLQALGAVLCPCVVQLQTNQKMAEYDTVSSKGSKVFWILCLSVPPSLFYLFHICGSVSYGYAMVAWVMYCGFVLVGVVNRISIRERYNIKGSGVSDCIHIFFCYFNAISQEHYQVATADLEKTV